MNQRVSSKYGRRERNQTMTTNKQAKGDTDCQEDAIDFGAGITCPACSVKHMSAAIHYIDRVVPLCCCEARVYDRRPSEQDQDDVFLARASIAVNLFRASILHEEHLLLSGDNKCDFWPLVEGALVHAEHTAVSCLPPGDSQDGHKTASLIRSLRKKFEDSDACPVLLGELDKLARAVLFDNDVSASVSQATAHITEAIRELGLGVYGISDGVMTDLFAAMKRCSYMSSFAIWHTVCDVNCCNALAVESRTCVETLARCVRRIREDLILPFTRTSAPGGVLPQGKKEGGAV